jgi:hypothetical protein
MTEYTVEIQPDFLERQAKAQPLAAVAELVWNGLDADATVVSVDFEEDALGGMAKIIVTDDGHGIPYEEAPPLFRHLGGSWKKRAGVTKTRKRMLHGQDGKGRFKAFALGSVVDWTITYLRASKLYQYNVSITDRDIRHVHISDELPARPGAKTGVRVAISELKRGNLISLRADNSVQGFSEIFAIYLKNYRTVTISISSPVNA